MATPQARPRNRYSTVFALLEMAERFVTNRDHAVTTEEMEELQGDVLRYLRRQVDADAPAHGPPVLTALEKLLVDVLVMIHGRPRNGSWLNQYARRRLLMIAGELLPDAREALGRALDARAKGYDP
jgi:hypothetical protein